MLTDDGRVEESNHEMREIHESAETVLALHSIRRPKRIAERTAIPKGSQKLAGGRAAVRRLPTRNTR